MKFGLVIAVFLFSCSVQPETGSVSRELTCATFKRGVNGTVADATVSAGFSTGTSSTLYTGATSSTAAMYRTLLRFDLSSIPSGATVTSAELTVKFNNSSTALTTVRLHHATSDWTEAAPAWSTTYDPSVAASFTTGAWTGTRVVNVASSVGLWAGGAVNRGFLMEENAGNRTGISSSETAEASRPSLTVCYEETAPGEPDASPPPPIDASVDAAVVVDASPPDAAVEYDASPGGQDLVFDHTDIDVASISSSCLNTLKSGSVLFHYGHRSHGSQIIVGANSLETTYPELVFEQRYCNIPPGTGKVKMWDGMINNSLVSMDQYWSTESGRNDLWYILNNNPSIKYTSWAWSFEISTQTEASIASYLSILSGLEQEFPNVRFVYMTGPAATTSYNAVNIMQRNAQIRAYAVQNNKLLFDFEDLDSHWNGEQYTQVFNGYTVPMEHPHFSLSTPGNTEYQWTHTTQASAEQKARAFWGMLADMECGQ